MKELRALNKYFWKYRVRLGIGAFFIIISNYFAVLAPQITGFIIDYVQKNFDGHQQQARVKEYDVLVEKFISFVEKKYAANTDLFNVVILCGVTIIFLALIRGFFMFLMRQTIIVMSRHIEYDQKNEVYSHYQKLDTAFYKTHSTGDLMSRMAEDVSRVRMFTGPAIMYLINLVTLISLSVFYMLRRDVELTIYVLAPLPVLAITIYYVNTIINKRSEKIQGLLAKLTANAQESYSGIRVIKSFVQEKAMLGFFEKNSEEYKKNAIGLAKVESLYFPSMALLIGLSTLLTIMIGGLYFINSPGRISIGAITEFIIYINMLTFPVSAIGWTASMIQRAAASQKRLNEFLQTKPEIVDNNDSLKVELKGNIDFKNVDFIYPHTGIHALKNFNLSIKSGEKIAIVGRTGSGKSTIAQLLLKMYNATKGQIEVEAVEISSINIKNLREQISYVPQDIFLFSETISSNISFGLEKNQADLKESAAKQASIHSEIKSFKHQYDTLVGERGITLSGGQKQRISIARALARQAGLVIFDDCLSAVDVKTEKEIIGNLQDYIEQKTAIIITHRIFSLFEFDKIIVLDDGEIVESGTHTELLKKNGYYSDLYYRQQEQENSLNS
ncbi:MAG TPA: ABC transporter ATP-binding protein [Chitinophagaceae bacterium]|nr:ABC transporter ATP-binding protein [Chitinophagaceae bacterium]